ncbi:hypothetical protein BDR07DRAFT_1480731 [Suillus spraguei]|nr:hypothetical protein BDR07DRAFT_1480731 [Suillus spraguei]
MRPPSSSSATSSGSPSSLLTLPMLASSIVAEHTLFTRPLPPPRLYTPLSLRTLQVPPLPDAEIPGPVPKKHRVTELQDSDVDVDEGHMSPVAQMKGVAVKEKEQWSGTSQQAIDNEFLADEPIEEVSDFQPSRDDEEDSKEEIEDDLEEPKSLSAECFFQGQKPNKLTWTAEPYPFPSSQPRTTKINKTQSARDHKRANETPVWADTQVVASDKEPELMQTAESFPFPSSQPRLHKTKKAQSARDHKRANETPVWKVVVSDEEPEAVMVSSDCSDSEQDDPDAPVECSGRLKLVRMDTGKLKLTDQDIDTCRVVQRAILEAKVHMTFINGYPELTEKSLFTQDALLTAARACSVLPIQDCLKSDDSAMCTLQEKNNPIPQSKRPYFTDILPYLMKGRYFNRLKSVRVNFSDCFKKSANNKAQRPEVTIPMVALTSTSVYAALFWKANGSPSKFNFTGNLFSEVYFFHVKFLEDMKVTAPHKFHKMMANIFEAIQKLCTNSNAALVGSHESAMAFLNINSMDDKE